MYRESIKHINIYKNILTLLYQTKDLLKEIDILLNKASPFYIEGPTDVNFQEVTQSELDEMKYKLFDIENLFNDESSLQLSSLFKNNTNLTALILNNWDTSNITDMSDIFGNSVVIPPFPENTEVTINTNQQSNQTVIQTVNESDNDNVNQNVNHIVNDAVNTQSNQNASQTVSQSVNEITTNDNLQTLDDQSNVTLLHNDNLTTIDVKYWDTSNVTTMDNMFCGCNNVRTLNLQGYDIKSLLTLSRTFAYCLKLKYLYTPSSFNDIITDMSYMCYNCALLPLINLSNIEPNKLTDLSGTFAGCTLLQTVSVPKGITNDINLPAMFFYCMSLTNLDLSGMINNVDGQINATDLFYGCKALQTINLSGWNVNTSNLTLTNAFVNTPSLTEVILNDCSPEFIEIINDALIAGDHQTNWSNESNKDENVRQILSYKINQNFNNINGKNIVNQTTPYMVNTNINKVVKQTVNQIVNQLTLTNMVNTQSNQNANHSVNDVVNTQSNKSVNQSTLTNIVNDVVNTQSKQTVNQSTLTNIVNDVVNTQSKQTVNQTVNIVPFTTINVTNTTLKKVPTGFNFNTTQTNLETNFYRLFDMKSYLLTRKSGLKDLFKSSSDLTNLILCHWDTQYSNDLLSTSAAAAE